MLDIELTPYQYHKVLSASFPVRTDKDQASMGRVAFVIKNVRFILSDAFNCPNS